MNNASASVAGRTQEHPLLWRSLSLASTDLVFLVVQAEGRAEKHDPDLSPFITLPPPTSKHTQQQGAQAPATNGNTFGTLLSSLLPGLSAARSSIPPSSLALCFSDFSGGGQTDPSISSPQQNEVTEISHTSMSVRWQISCGRLEGPGLA